MKPIKYKPLKKGNHIINRIKNRKGHKGYTYGCLVLNSNMYQISDKEFEDYITRKRYKEGKITKEEAFVELI